MKISIVIPIYNEKSTIAELIARVERVQLPGHEKELLLIDDCSTDGTREILAQWEGKHRIIYHKQNAGKGGAVKTGIEHALGEVVIIQDADLEFDPAQYPLLLGPIFQNLADVVYGSRFVGDYPHRVLYFWHYCGNRFLTLLSNVFTNLNLTDMETGYKVFRREVLHSFTLAEKRFGFEPEITAKIAKQKKWRIYEVGISYAGRTYEEGKKISWRDGVWAIWCIIRYNIFN